MKKQFKKAVEAAKNSRLGKGIAANKGVIAGTIVNAGATAYAWRKGGAKAGLAAAAGSAAWAGLSALYFKALEAQERAEQPKADPFDAARRKAEAKSETGPEAAPEGKAGTGKRRLTAHERAPQDKPQIRGKGAAGKDGSRKGPKKDGGPQPG
jgi:hypothetical protein